MNDFNKTTSKGWRVGDRVAWNPGYGAVILEIVDGDECHLRFDDNSEGVHDLSSLVPWRRLRSKKITFKESKR